MPTWLSPFFSSIISACVAFAILYINHLRDKNKAEAGDEKTWRQARLDAEKKLSERIDAETRERTKWELESDGDLARVAEILKEVNETQKLTAALAATSQHHTSELTRINNRVEDVSRQLNQFVITHGKHA